MFKFLFGRDKATPEPVIETQRETVTRALDELNAVFALMADRPKLGVDLNSGLITIDLPEQMPDEALALPKPEESGAADPVEQPVEEAAEKAVQEADKTPA